LFLRKLSLSLSGSLFQLQLKLYFTFSRTRPAAPGKFVSQALSLHPGIEFGRSRTGEGSSGEEEGGGVRSGPGAARTILLFRIISARPPKQPLFFISRGFGRRMHLGVEVTESSTNKQHHLSYTIFVTTTSCKLSSTNTCDMHWLMALLDVPALNKVDVLLLPVWKLQKHVYTVSVKPKLLRSFLM
jgi:hypothetical protein